MKANGRRSLIRYAVSLIQSIAQDWFGPAVGERSSHSSAITSRWAVYAAMANLPACRADKLDSRSLSGPPGPEKHESAGSHSGYGSGPCGLGRTQRACGLACGQPAPSPLVERRSGWAGNPVEPRCRAGDCYLGRHGGKVVGVGFDKPGRSVTADEMGFARSESQNGATWRGRVDYSSSQSNHM